VYRQFAFAEVEGLFAGFDEAGTSGVSKFEAVLDDGECGVRSAECGTRGKLFHPHDLTVE